MELFEETYDVMSVLEKYNNVEEVFKVVYQGKGVSLNDYYSAGHWSKRSNIKTKYKAIFNELIEKAAVRPVVKFSIIIRYNSRHDPDNVTGLEKVFVDTLKGNIIRDDTKRYYRGFMVFPDERLPLNTFEFYIVSHGE